MPQATAPASRYERVQQILDEAHLGSTANYQGHGWFWRLPIDRLLTVVVYGVRMIAPGTGGSSGGQVASTPRPPPPVKTGSCCGGGGGSGAGGSAAEPPPPAPSAQPGRGAASGLVKGLRGEHPYDGSVFPALPWGGGKAVSATDIAFIEKWIDDGCPVTDAAANEQAADASAAAPDGTEASSDARALAYGSKLHKRSTRPVNDYRNDGNGLKVRKNIDSLDATELTRYRRALAQMKSLDGYERDQRSFAYWAKIHANNCQHGWEEFLPWHRLYLYYFEQQLLDIDPSVTLPYWDWTSLYDVNQPVNQTDSGTIPVAFRCFVDDSVLRSLKGVISESAWNALATLNDPNLTYDSGPRLFAAANLPYDDSAQTESIVAALEVGNPLWHRFRWPGGGVSSGLLFEEYPSADDITNILNLGNFFQFASGPDNNHFFGALENVHNLMHNFSGGNNPNTLPNEPSVGDMVDAGVTAFDPIFWSHHANVDRLWAEWQVLHPGQGPDNPAAILAPWNGTVADTANISALGYEYALSTHTFETDRNAPMVSFKSAMAEVPARVCSSHRRAEIRLTKVPHLKQGGILRIFLNQADADARTPTRGNPGFVGQVHLFAGDCIGGPGHCDIPPEETRKFDRRPRHRKTPHAVRLDATSVVARLRAAGASDFHVQVVALDLRGQPSEDVLRLDAVSLIFFD